MFPVSLVQGGLGAFGLRRYLVDPGRLRRLLARNLPVVDLARTPLPCHLVATDLTNGEEVVLPRAPRWRPCSPAPRSRACSRP